MLCSTGCRRNRNINAQGDWLLIWLLHRLRKPIWNGCFRFVVTSQHESVIKQREAWKTVFLKLNCTMLAKLPRGTVGCSASQSSVTD